MDTRVKSSQSQEEQRPLLQYDQFAGRVPAHDAVNPEHRVEIEVDPSTVDFQQGEFLNAGHLASVDQMRELLEFVNESDGEYKLAARILPNEELEQAITAQHGGDHSNNHTEESEEDSDNDQDPAEVAPPKSKWRFVLYAFPVADALFDAVETCTGLIDGPMAFNAPVTLINFFSTFGLNAKFGVSGTEDLVFVFKNIRDPKIPPAWNRNEDGTENEKLHNLSRGSEITAFTIASVMTIFAAIGDSVQCEYFMNELPKVVGFDKSKYFYPTPWKVFGASVAALEALSVVTSEGPASWQEGRKILAGVHKQYRTAVGRVIGRTVGIPLGIGDSLRDGLLSYIGIMYIFGFSGNLAKAGVGFWGFMTAVCNYSTNGQNIVDHFDRFFGAFVEDENGVVQAKDYKNILSFIISAGAGGLFGYAQKQLIEEELTKLVESLGVEKPILVLAMAYWCFASVSVNSTGNVFDLVYLLVNASDKGAKWLWNKIKCGNCCAPDDPFDPENIAVARHLSETGMNFEVLVEGHDSSEDAIQAMAKQRSSQREEETLLDFDEDDRSAEELNFDDFAVIIDPPPSEGVAIPQADKSRLFRSHSTSHMDQAKQKSSDTLRFSQ